VKRTGKAPPQGRRTGARVATPSPATARVVEALRAVIRRTAPGTEESVAWGALSFHRPWIGGRVKGAVCQIVVKDGAVRLDFIHGVRLPDPERLLRGDGVSKRHVPIETVAAAKRPAIALLIRNAADVAF
jgi:hypothetical protein